MIVDHGYVIFEGTGTEFGINYAYLTPGIYFSLRDKIQHGHFFIDRAGSVSIGYTEAPGDVPKADVMEMSFVLELVGSGELPMSSKDEDQVWYKESSDALLQKVDKIFAGVIIRDLRREERIQMNKFKYSLHDAKFKVAYKDGAAHFQSYVKTTASLDLDSKRGRVFIMSTSGEEFNENMKSIHLEEIEGKSFAIEDAAKGNCENLESSGFKGYCEGDLWVKRL